MFVGPEAEFFVFDDVKFSTNPYKTGFELDGIELPKNSDRDYETGNMGHRMRTKGGYFPVNPMDSAQDMRGEMLSVMAKWASSSKSTTTRWPPASTNSAPASSRSSPPPTTCRSTST